MLEEKDYISDLPDSIIHQILSFLPSTKETIRTGVLSKRWKNQWTHVPVLIFEDSDFEMCHYHFDSNQWMKWECLKILELEKCSLSNQRIEKALSGSPLLEALELRYCNWHNEIVIASESLRKVTLYHIMSNVGKVLCPKLEVFTCVYSMLCGEVVQNISSGSPLLESLEFHCFALFRRHEQLVISSKSLKKVIFYDIMSTVAQILCPNLQELTCYECMFCDEVIQNISYRSPLLESLKLRNCSILSLEQLTIASESLKILVLGYSSIYERARISLFELVCPKLEELHLSGCDFLPSSIVNLSSLIRATLDFRYYTSGDENSLQKLQHVKELTVSHTSLKVLSNITMAPRSSFLTNSLILELNRLDDSHHGIVWALQNFHVLEKLTIKLYPDNGECISLFETLCQYVRSYITKNYWDSCNTVFYCLASHLRILKIIGFSKRNEKCKLALDLIEFLWKNGRVLEKVVVVMSNYCDAKFRSGVYRKLLSFQRYNNHVTVELLHEIKSRP